MSALRYDLRSLQRLCMERGIRITPQRHLVLRILVDSQDHPDVETVYQRAVVNDAKLSIATVYRTMKLFEEAGILDRHEFRENRARYEISPDSHHDHLIDIKSGRIIEFVDPEIEALQSAIAERLGYRLIDHRLELYGQPL